MVSLNTPLSLPALTELLSRAWVWWNGELVQTIPPTLRARLIAQRPLLLIHLTETQATIGRAEGDMLVSLAEIDVSTGPSEADLSYIRQALQAIDRPSVCVCLAPSMALCREIELPQSAEGKLREVVGLDLDRQTPFPPEKAAFDVAVRERFAESGRIKVALAVVRRETIDAVLSLCRRLGLEPDQIAIGRRDTAEARFDLLAGYRDGARFRWREHPRLAAGIALSLLLALNAGLAIWRADARVTLLKDQLTKARVEAQATEKLRAELTRNQSEARLLIASHARLGALETLDALTRALPDDVWLSDFELNDASVSITGFAPSAPDLIARMDKTGRFANPHFKAPVTRTDRTGQDRFEISFDIRQAPAK